MTEKEQSPTTFKLGKQGVKMAIELRHAEEVRLGRVVSIAEIVRNALKREYKRVMGKEAEKEDADRGV